MTDLPFTLDLAVSMPDPAWADLTPNLQTRTEEITSIALQEISRVFELKPIAGSQQPSVEISLVFTNDSDIRALNRDYRGKDQPTNVLSFPDSPLDQAELEQAVRLGEPLLLGDIVLARETLIREADAQHKSVSDHFAHLLCHGVLHLAGFDHMDENEAVEMENLEIMILRRLHIANPYELSDQPRQETPDLK